MSEIEPIPPALQALYAEERLAPVAGPAEREQLRLRVLATIESPPLPPILWEVAGKGDTRKLLLARRLAGDRATTQALFEHTHQIVARFFANKVQGEVIDDLVQSTLLSCFGELAPPRAWPVGTDLLAAAHRVLMSHLRQRSRFAANRDRDRIDAERLFATGVLAEPFASFSSKEEHQILLAALRRLPIKLQIVIELHYWESLTVREIAEVIRKPLGIAKTRLRDARIQLRNQLLRGDLPRDLRQSALDTLEGWADRVRTRVRDAS